MAGRGFGDLVEDANLLTDAILEFPVTADLLKLLLALFLRPWFVGPRDAVLRAPQVSEPRSSPNGSSYAKNDVAARGYQKMANGVGRTLSMPLKSGL